MTDGLPDFLVVGAPKAGTTSLQYYLMQHPEIFMSEPKEPKFFAFENSDLIYSGPKPALDQLRKSTVTEFGNYKAMFSRASSGQKLGEVSPIYFHNAQAPARIRHYVPNCKIIVILRNPMERAYSDWKHNLSYGYETIRSFRKALEAWSNAREADNWIPYANYVEKGYYAKHLSRYLRYFKRNQLAIFLFEDLEASASEVLNSIFRFLGVTEDLPIDTNHRHMVSKPVSACPRLQWLAQKWGAPTKDRLIKPIELAANFFRKSCLIPDRIADADYSWLLNRYRRDIEALQGLIGRDLRGWLEPSVRRAECGLSETTRHVPIGEHLL